MLVAQIPRHQAVFRRIELIMRVIYSGLQKAQGRLFSSRAARPEHLRAYLDVWMGSVASAPDMRITSTRDGGALALTVTGRQYLVPTLRLPVDATTAAVEEGLKATVSLAASFKSAPIVLDLSEWSAAQRLRRSQGPMDTAAKLHACLAVFRGRGLHPVGVSNAYTPELQHAALELGLPCFMGQPTMMGGGGAAVASTGAAQPSTRDTARRERVASGRGSSAASSPEPSTPASSSPAPHRQQASEGATTQEDSLPPHVVQGSVRTGQQVIASEGRSLVVMGNVHSGAEVAADGDIHVYGKLSGRALAGLSGNVKARVFAAKFNAELVAVADCFVTGDQPSDLKDLVVNAATIVSLDGKARELVFKSFT